MRNGLIMGLWAYFKFDRNKNPLHLKGVVQTFVFCRPNLNSPSVFNEFRSKTVFSLVRQKQEKGVSRPWSSVII